MPSTTPRPGARTVSTCLRDSIRILKDAGIEGARLDAQVLMGDVLGVDRLALITDPDRILSVEEAGRFNDRVKRRTQREPVSHILGQREFWSLPFKVTAATLAPRPDSETLVMAVLEFLRESGREKDAVRILDLGVGTGCLILSLLHELPHAEGTGVDRSAAAAAVANENARRLGLSGRIRLLVGDWAEPLDEGTHFEVVISNPPYISDPEFAGLAPDVAAFEPEAALRGGVDGLDAYRRLIPGAVRRLEPGGALFLEIGADQAVAVSTLCRAAGLMDVRVTKDMAGLDRVISGRKMKKGMMHQNNGWKNK